MSRVAFDRTTNPLLRDGYVYSMVLQHEYQHNETILQTLQLKQGAPYRAPRAYRSRQHPGRDGCSRTRGHGAVSRRHACELGTTTDATAYDNERPRHAREVAPFCDRRLPVTNGDFLEFIRDGGYARRELWSDAGRRWLADAKVEAPKYWMRDGDEWCVRVMDDVRSVAPDHPVCHVSLSRSRGIRAVRRQATAD